MSDNGIDLLYADNESFVVEITSDEGFDEILKLLEMTKGRKDDEREI